MRTSAPRTLVPGLLLGLGGSLLAPTNAAIGEEAVRRVNLRQALEEFVENSLALKIARSEAAEVAGAARQSRVYSNPSVAFDRDQLEHGPDGFREQTIRFEQEVEWPGRVSARRRAADHTINASEAGLRADSVELAFEVREAYALAWFAEEAERSAGRTLTVIRSVTEDAEARLEAGDISAYEARRLRLERVRAEQEAADAGLRTRAARRRLAALISPGTGTEEVGPATGLEQIPPPVALEAALRGIVQRPDLEAAARELDAAQAEVDIASFARRPSPTFGLGYRDDSDGFGGASVGVTVPLPVFDRGHGTREETAARSSAAAYRLDLRRRLAEYDVVGALDRYAASRARVETAVEGLLADGESLLSSATAAYAEQEMTLVELLDAAGAFQGARLTALSLQSEAWIAYYDLLRAMGRGPEEGS